MEMLMAELGRRFAKALAPHVARLQGVSATVTAYGTGVRVTVLGRPAGKRATPPVLACITTAKPPPTGNAQALKAYTHGLVGAAVQDMRVRATTPEKGA